MTMETKRSEYLSCAETAKIVRQALKTAFPGVKCSVRSGVYGGGASIGGRYTDGPRERDVKSVCEAYAGGRFDGMIDLAYKVFHYLRADGTVMLARDPGTLGNGGSNPGGANTFLEVVLPADARLVRFGADYVFVQREVSDHDAKYDQAVAWCQAHLLLDGEYPHQRFGNPWILDLARSMVHVSVEGETWRDAFEVVTG